MTSLRSVRHAAHADKGAHDGEVDGDGASIRDNASDPCGGTGNRG
jgi:hypothetical protein